jgi:hypothetical protein
VTKKPLTVKENFTMTEKLYRRLVALVLALGMLTTTALVAYTAYLHNHVSIITYVAKEGY